MSVKDSWRRAKFKLKHDFLTVENVVLFFAIVLCLVWTYQSIAAMSRNWDLADNLTRQKSQLELLDIEVETLSLENEYYQTEEYQDLMARKLLDKQLPGEKMVVMPENSEAAKTKHQTEEETASELGQEPERSNFEQWMMYLFPSY